MIIKKFNGKTEAEARGMATAQLGESAVIMNIKTVKPTGFFRFLKRTTYEVTAAIEDEKDNYVQKPFSVPAGAEKTEEKTAGETLNARDSRKMEHATQNDNGQLLEERIENLQHFLEEQFKQEQQKKEGAESESQEEEESSQNLAIVKMIYKKLLDNEVDEKYVNQIMEEVGKAITPSAGLDSILSMVYQRIILKFGQPKGIDLAGKKPKVVFFVGPTGVGKTTTIAKIASHYKVEQGKSIALLTADTYRIAAADQLRIYANILDVPLTIIYSAEELNNAVEAMADYEIILVDTAGFSYKNEQQRQEMKHLLESLDERFSKEVYLVVSATTKYKDLLEIADSFTDLSDYKLIFTKLDETTAYGNLLNIKLHTQAEMSYATNGQNVPDDIEVFNTQRIVKQLLGGK